MGLGYSQGIKHRDRQIKYRPTPGEVHFRPRGHCITFMLYNSGGILIGPIDQCSAPGNRRVRYVGDPADVVNEVQPGAYCCRESIDEHLPSVRYGIISGIRRDVGVIDREVSGG